MSLFTALSKLLNPFSKATAAVAVVQLWRELDENGQLTKRIEGILGNLKQAATLPDPSAKLRNSLHGLDVYLSEENEIPEELSQTWRKQIHDYERRLDLADTLEPKDRKRIIKEVKGELVTVLQQALLFGKEVAEEFPAKESKPKKLRGRKPKKQKETPEVSAQTTSD